MLKEVCVESGAKLIQTFDIINKRTKTFGETAFTYQIQLSSDLKLNDGCKPSHAEQDRLDRAGDVCLEYETISNVALFFSVSDSHIPTEPFTKNIALNKPTSMSSVNHKYVACKGVDGKLTGFAHTKNSDTEWWCVDLEKVYDFQSVVLYNRRSKNQ
ncbi:hypothetical protein LOTGIDRAFT_176706, partial [Lottia gigantea]